MLYILPKHFLGTKKIYKDKRFEKETIDYEILNMNNNFDSCVTSKTKETLAKIKRNKKVRKKVKRNCFKNIIIKHQI